MSKIKDKLEEKRKVALINKIGQKYYDDLRPNILNKSSDEMISYLSSRWINELQKNEVYTLGDVSISIAEIIEITLQILGRTNSQLRKVCLVVAETIDNKIKADIESNAINEDVVEVMNNKPKQIEENKSTFKKGGLRV